MNSTDDHGQSRNASYFQLLLDTLVLFLVLHPPEGEDAHCPPPAFIAEPGPVDCSQYPTALTGGLRKASRQERRDACMHAGPTDSPNR